MTNKVYLVSEEVLRQVLDELETGFGCSRNSQETLRTILAKEPNDPAAWINKNNIVGRTMMKFDMDEEVFPLYRKDL